MGLTSKVLAAILTLGGVVLVVLGVARISTTAALILVGGVLALIGLVVIQVDR